MNYIEKLTIKILSNDIMWNFFKKFVKQHDCWLADMLYIAVLKKAEAKWDKEDKEREK